MFRFIAGVLCALVAASGAWAADQPQYGPPPAWVKPVPIPADAPPPGAAAVQLLLRNDQMAFGSDGDSFYSERATKVLSAQGLQLLGNVILSWQPSTDTLTIHKAEIIRDGHAIDLLGAGKKVTVLRRETDLEMAMLDGSLTATIQPEGLRVGDILHLAYTIKRNDPVMAGRSQGFWTLGELETAHAYMRAIWPRSKRMTWRATEGLSPPALAATPDGSELSIDAKDAEAPPAPADAPARYANLGQLQLSEFRTWSDVAALMAPLYEKASVLGPASPVLAEARKIAAQTSDPGQRALAALALVQNDVRYLFLGMGQGGLTPADADLTWTRRFGDCKAKTALLLAILHQLGVEAQPALVSTTGGDGLDERLPNLELFDHVLVRAVIGGHVYWLDGTRTGDRTLANIETPSFHWALPLAAHGAALERLEQTPFARPHFESLVRLDATAGLDRPAPAHVEHVLRGDRAIAMHEAHAAEDAAERERTLKAYWREAIPWIEPQKVDLAYDAETTTATLTMDGVAKIDWAASSGGRDFDVADSSLGWDASYARDSGPEAGAPYAVAFPMYKKWTVIVRLPGKGAGFSLVNAAAVDRTAAGIRFHRTAELADGVVTIEADEQALKPEFPASEAKADEAALREMADYDVEVRASGAAADAGDNAGAQAALASLLEAAKKAQEGDGASVYATMKPLVQTSGYGQLGAAQRAAGLFLLASAAFEQKDYATSHETAVKSTDIDPNNQLAWRYRIGSAQVLNDWNDAAISIATIARRWPDSLKTLPDSLMLTLVRQSRGASRLDALTALHDAHWTPRTKELDPSTLWFQLAADLLAKGDAKQAALVAHDISAYRELIEMHADKRFDAIIAADPAAFDVAKSIERDLERRRADVKASPTKLEAVNQLGYALLARGKAAEALAIAQDALAKSQVDPEGKSFFEDREDQLNRTLELQAEALRDLGRTDEAIKSGQRSAARPEHGASNVSQALDLASRLDDLGRPQDALDTLQDFDPKRASPYGMMVWRADLACAYAQLKDAARLGPVMAAMKAHAADGPMLYQGALECAGDSDGLAHAIIASIEDPETRATVLLGLQDYLRDPSPQSDWRKHVTSFETSVYGRPDVKSVVAKYGRIASYPLREPD